jgi:hypothetical protein
MRAAIEVLTVVLVVVGLLGCAAGELPMAATPLPDTAEISMETPTRGVSIPTPEGKAVVSPIRVTAQSLEEVTPPPAAEKAVELAVKDLAAAEGVAEETIRLVSVEAVEWSDASLGCPEPDMVYAQVITPGYLVVLELEGELFEYHTDDGRFVVQCQDAK